MSSDVARFKLMKNDTKFENEKEEILIEIEIKKKTYVQWLLSAQSLDMFGTTRIKKIKAWKAYIASLIIHERSLILMYNVLHPPHFTRICYKFPLTKIPLLSRWNILPEHQL